MHAQHAAILRQEIHTHVEYMHRFSDGSFRPARADIFYKSKGLPVMLPTLVPTDAPHLQTRHFPLNSGTARRSLHFGQRLFLGPFCFSSFFSGFFIVEGEGDTLPA